MWPAATKAGSVLTLRLIEETLCEQSSHNLCCITEETSRHFFLRDDGVTAGSKE